MQNGVLVEMSFNMRMVMKKKVSMKKAKKINCASRYFDFLFPSQLARMSDGDHVLVDSSTICAIVQDYAFSGVKENIESMAILEKMEMRMFKSQKKRNAILFGEYIDMTIVEVAGIFGNIEKVPIGIVKKVKKRGRHH